MKAKIELSVWGSYEHALNEGRKIAPRSAKNIKVRAKLNKNTNIYDVTVNYENNLSNSHFSVQDFCNNLKTNQKGK